ncbi:hypothetical protein TgHK011_000868 [Trichoderma gracile]|nr:hypothetical protein TgHK011_000868 [Trichoderma gracile]
MKDIKDAECGVVPQKKLSVAQKARKGNLLDLKIMTSVALSICIVAGLLAITVLVAHCAGLERPYQAQGAVSVVSAEAIPVVDHKLERRAADCNETESAMSAASAQVLTLVLDDGSLAVVTQDSVSYPAVSLTSIPISTETATSTIYSIITPSTPAVVTKTLTMTTSILSSSEVPICSALDTTVTVTVTVQPAPSPWASSSVLGDVTVTAGASTITNVNTDVSYTSGLPDATVSGNPSTITNVDVSMTGLPDVTVSGNPATVTNLLTDISLTSGLPDATISGNPSTITAIQTSYSLPRQPVTSLVTVVISDLWSPPASSSPATDLPPPPSSSPSPPYIEPSQSTTTTTTAAYDSSKAGAETIGQSTLVRTVTATTVQSATSTTTVFMTPVFSSYNGTAASSSVPVGTATSIALPSIPVVVSGSSGNVGQGAQGRVLAGFIVAVAAVMAML